MQDYTYTIDDFDTTKPYNDLELIQNDFDKQVAEHKLEAYAQKIGYKHFKRMLLSFRRSLRQTSITNYGVGIIGYTNFENQKIEFTLNTWNADESGIWRKGRDGLREKACSHPICPNRIMTNIDTGEVKVELWFRRGYESYPKMQIVDYDTIANAKNIVSLAKIGIDVDSNSAKNLVAYLSEIINLNYDIIPKTKAVSHLGWNGEGFAPFSNNVEFDGNPNFEKIFKAINCKGDMETWINEIEKCRKYSKVVKILIAASYASCLIEPLGVLPFFVHLWGLDSGTGKTVAQMCAASVWGNPTVGDPFFPTFKGTQVGFEFLAGFLRDIPLIMDELQLTKDGHGKANFNVYELASGTGKIRGTRTLGLAAVPRWNICFITSGETPLVGEHDGAGALNRVIEIECTAKQKCIENGHDTATTLKENYGFGGRTFVHMLQKNDNIKRAKEMYEKFYAECITDQATDKQAMAVATLLTADALACEYTFNDDPLTVADMKEFFKTNESVSLSQRGYKYICDWVGINFNKFATVHQASIDKGEIYGEIETTGPDTYAYIIRTVFNRACESEGINPKALLSHFKSNGLIKIRSDGKGYCIKRRMSGGLLNDCVALKIEGEIIDVDDIDL